MTIDKNIETLGEVEYGDFQTPNYFAEKICTFLRDNIEKDIDKAKEYYKIFDTKE